MSIYLFIYDLVMNSPNDIASNPKKKYCWRLSLITSKIVQKIFAIMNVVLVCMLYFNDSKFSYQWPRSDTFSCNDSNICIFCWAQRPMSWLDIFYLTSVQRFVLTNHLKRKWKGEEWHFFPHLVLYHSKYIFVSLSIFPFS